MERPIRLGVDGMFANFPGCLERVLGDRAAPGSRGAALAAAAFRACREGKGSGGRATVP
jgi:hypothetical protein